MNNLEFLKFTEVKDEKYLGIATIRFEKRFIFRYKIQPSEKGGFFAFPASYKVTEFGKESYIPSFQFDSSYESDEIKKFVIRNVEQILVEEHRKNSAPVQQQQSLFKDEQAIPF